MPTPTETITITPPKRKRVQLKHLLIDVDFWDKPKIRALAFKHGQCAVHVLLRWLACMSRATNGEVTRDALFSLAKDTIPHGVGEAICSPELILAFCLKNKILQLEGDSYTNDRVIKDQESCASKRDEAANRQKNYREKSKKESNALLTRFPVPDPVTDTDTEDPKKGEPEGGGTVFKKLRFDPMEWAGLVMNHFYGDEAKARDVCEAASDYLAQEGKPMPRDCLAYMRGWIRKSKEFARGATGPKKKLTTEELNPELFEEIFK